MRVYDIKQSYTLTYLFFIRCRYYNSKFFEITSSSLSSFFFNQNTGFSCDQTLFTSAIIRRQGFLLKRKIRKRKKRKNTIGNFSCLSSCLYSIFLHRVTTAYFIVRHLSLISFCILFFTDHCRSCITDSFLYV